MLFRRGIKGNGSGLARTSHIFDDDSITSIKNIWSITYYFFNLKLSACGSFTKTNSNRFAQANAGSNFANEKGSGYYRIAKSWCNDSDRQQEEQEAPSSGLRPGKLGTVYILASLGSFLFSTVTFRRPSEHLWRRTSRVKSGRSCWGQHCLAAASTSELTGAGGAAWLTAGPTP